VLHGGVVGHRLADLCARLATWLHVAGHEQKNGHLGSIYKDMMDVTDFTISPKLRTSSCFSPLQTGTAHAQGVKGSIVDITPDFDKPQSFLLPADPTEPPTDQRPPEETSNGVGPVPEGRRCV
jgi:hypothetical protein